MPKILPSETAKYLILADLGRLWISYKQILCHNECAMVNNACLKCGSTDIFSGAEVRTQDSNSRHPVLVLVNFPRLPGSHVYRGPESSEVRATICGTCGFTEFHTIRHRELLSAVRQQQLTLVNNPSESEKGK